MKRLSKAMLTVALVFVAAQASYAAWPEHPVTLIVPAAPGGSTDILARVLSTELSNVYGQSFVVENRSGAGGNIGVAAVAKARPDGYTLLISASTNHVVNPILIPNTPFKGVDDFEPVAYLANVLTTVVVNPSLPVNNIKELVAYAKANPGKISYSSGGNGSTNHIGVLMFEKVTGTQMVHVPYRGGAPAVLAAVSGETPLLFGAGTQTLPHVKAGKLRLLAVTEKNRSKILPDIPTIGESVPGYEMTIWYGAFAPVGTPAEIVKSLNAEINKVFAKAAVREQMAAIGVEPIAMTPAEFLKVLRKDGQVYANLIKDLNIKVE